MKNFLLIVFVVLPAYLFAQQTNLPAKELDVFKLSLNKVGSSTTETINLYVDTRYVKEWDSVDMGFDGLGASNTTHMFSSLAYSYVHNATLRLNKDKRGKDEYPTNFYVDFPLYMEKLEIGESYRFSVVVMDGKVVQAAVCFRIIDTKNPQDLHFIWENGVATAGWSFTATEAKPEGRFIARVYAACLWKKDAENTKWSDPNNWIGAGGDVPGQSSDKKRNNCVFIPTDTEVELEDNVSIHQLFLQGKLTVREDAVLTVENTSLIDIQKAY